MVINVKFCGNHGNHYFYRAHRGFIYARVLVLKLFISRLSLSVMAETGCNCAISAFYRLGMG